MTPDQLEALEGYTRQVLAEAGVALEIFDDATAITRPPAEGWVVVAHRLGPEEHRSRSAQAIGVDGHHRLIIEIFRPRGYKARLRAEAHAVRGKFIAPALVEVQRTQVTDPQSHPKHPGFGGAQIVVFYRNLDVRNI